MRSKPTPSRQKARGRPARTSKGFARYMLNAYASPTMRRELFYTHDSYCWDATSKDSSVTKKDLALLDTKIQVKTPVETSSDSVKRLASVKIPVKNPMETSSNSVKRLALVMIPVKNPMETSSDSVKRLASVKIPVKTPMETSSDSVKRLASVKIPVKNPMETSSDSVKHLASVMIPVKNPMETSSNSVKRLASVMIPVKNSIETSSNSVKRLASEKSTSNDKKRLRNFAVETCSAAKKHISGTEKRLASVKTSSKNKKRLRNFAVETGSAAKRPVSVKSPSGTKKRLASVKTSSNTKKPLTILKGALHRVNMKKRLTSGKKKSSNVLSALDSLRRPRRFACGRSPETFLNNVKKVAEGESKKRWIASFRRRTVGDYLPKEVTLLPGWKRTFCFEYIRENLFLSRQRYKQRREEIPVCHCFIAESVDPCGEGCVNRLISVECSPEACPCGALCTNMRFQQCSYPAMMPFNAGEKGWGLITLQDIKQHQFVIEYVGEVISREHCQQRLERYRNDDHLYFMSLSSCEVIDASRRGNLSRFMNHSCDSNCSTHKWTVRGEICVGLFATGDIKAGTELTYNYQLDRLGRYEKKCHCGASCCSGIVGVPTAAE